MIRLTWISQHWHVVLPVPPVPCWALTPTCGAPPQIPPGCPPPPGVPTCPQPSSASRGGADGGGLLPLVSPPRRPPPHHSPRCSHLGSSLARSWRPFVDLHQCDCPSHKVRDHCGLLRLGPFSAGSESHPRPQIRLPRRGRRRRDGTPLIASQLPPL